MCLCVSVGCFEHKIKRPTTRGILIAGYFCCSRKITPLPLKTPRGVSFHHQCIFAPGDVVKINISVYYAGRSRAYLGVGTIQNSWGPAQSGFGRGRRIVYCTIQPKKVERQRLHIISARGELLLLHYIYYFSQYYRNLIAYTVLPLHTRQGMPNTIYIVRNVLPRWRHLSRGNLGQIDQQSHHGPARSDPVQYVAPNSHPTERRVCGFINHGDRRSTRHS